MVGSEAMLSTNAPTSALSTIAPINAVPVAEPSCCAVYCRPPASPRSSGPTADWITLPSCEAISPIATPRSARASPKARPSSSGPLDEVMNMVIEIGSILTPVSNAS